MKTVKIRCKGAATISIDKLVEFQEGIKHLTETGYQRAKASIQNEGFTAPFFIWKHEGKAYIIDGHQRLTALKRMREEEGWTVPDLPVAFIEAKTKTEAKRKLLVILSQYGEYSLPAMEDFLKDIDFSFLKEEVNIPDFSIDFAGELKEDDVSPLIDRADILKRQYKVRLGQVWSLGEHALLCGDSTKQKDVEKLMKGQRSVVCVTDPPYSVEYSKSHETRGGDLGVHSHYQEPKDAKKVLQFIDLLPTDVLVFSYSINRHLYEMCDALRKNKWEVRKELVWVKDVFSFWRGAAYQQKHEPILLCTRNGANFRGSVPANQSTVFEFPKPKAHDLHPTAKPVNLWAIFIKNHSKKGEIVYDPFCGSGTTIVAAEQLGRKCYAIEISPEYVAVSIQRWVDLTGGKPLLVKESHAKVTR